MLDGEFYLIGGVDLFPDAFGKPMRIYHRDAYRYSPTKGWRKLPAPPRSVVAAPSPALTDGNRLVVIGGDHGGAFGFRPPEKHPGFPRDVFAYDPQSDAWQSLGDQPNPIAVTALVPWQGGYVVASGELRPAIRSIETWFVRTR